MGMALTNAERQARYRARQCVPGRDGSPGIRRLSGYISGASALQLARLATYYGITKKAVIELAIADMDYRSVMRLPNPNARQAYSEGRLREDGMLIDGETNLLSPPLPFKGPG